MAATKNFFLGAVVYSFFATNTMSFATAKRAVLANPMKYAVYLWLAGLIAALTTELACPAEFDMKTNQYRKVGGGFGCSSLLNARLALACSSLILLALAAFKAFD